MAPADRAVPAPVVPCTVRRAVTLIYAGVAVLLVLQVVDRLVLRGAPPSLVLSALSPEAVVDLLLGVALEVVLAAAVLRGRSWARAVLAVLTAVAAAGAVLWVVDVAADGPGGSVALSSAQVGYVVVTDAIVVGLQVATVVLLYRYPSSAFSRVATVARQAARSRARRRRRSADP